MEINEIKENLYIVDLLAEQGHILFVKKIVEILKPRYNIFFVSTTTYCKEIEHTQCISLNDWFTDVDNKYSFVLKQIQFIKEVIKKIDKESPVIITGFENISFSLGWRRNNTLAFLHNNIDKKGISNFFFKKVKRVISYLVFENYIKAYLEKTIKNDIYYVPHPLTFTNTGLKKFSDENFIFAVNTNPNSFMKLFKDGINKDMKIYIKSNHKLKRKEKNVIVKSHFENYKEMIHEANFVALKAPYNYRISGVFYECMFFNKKIFLIHDNSLFGLEMEKLYPKNVVRNQIKSINDLTLDNSSFLTIHSDINIFNSLINAIE